MQSVQNLGLALVNMLGGTIVDNSGYLVLEVFFLACLCGRCPPQLAEAHPAQPLTLSRSSENGIIQF